MAHSGHHTFIETQLQQPLTTNENYTLEFYTIRREWSLYTTGEMGAYVSQDTFYNQDFRLQNINPQVKAQDSAYNDMPTGSSGLTSKARLWPRGEEFLTIGNFTHVSGYERVFYKASLIPFPIVGFVKPMMYFTSSMPYTSTNPLTAFLR
ncbi:MAG: hypothetical protein U5L96_20405 [Owenweeksia sp.]|nr:hypothetical protein [Owenweeksia sp.]